MSRLNYRSAKLLIGATLFLSVTIAQGQSRIDLDETTVQGASELPKVLVIVPWKKSEMDTKPVKLNSMVEEVMSPVDRDVLKRQVKFYEENKLGQ